MRISPPSGPAPLLRRWLLARLPLRIGGADSFGLFLLAALLSGVGPAAAQNVPPRFPRGTVIPQVVAASDTTEQYALYLPKSPSKDRRPPVLLLLDPRGRATTALGAFRPAAERLGYLVLSSSGTLSDEDDEAVLEANGRSIAAMMTDAVDRFGADPARVYLVGLSGAASFSWVAASFLSGHVAGVVGVGCPLTPGLGPVRAALSRPASFDYVAVAGTTDYNYDAAVVLDAALDSTRMAHQFYTFEGEHGWPPEPVARSAVEWLHYQAVRTGRAPADPSWTDSLRSAFLSEAWALASSGDEVGALRLYRDVATDDGSALAREAQRRSSALARSPHGQRARSQTMARAARYFEYERDVAAFAKRYAASGPLPHHEALRGLGLAQLRAAADTSGADDADAARRMLALAYVVTAFYEPRAYLRSESWAKAAGLLLVSRELRPRAPFACYGLAQAEAQLGRSEEAVEALSCAVDGGVLDRGALESDPLLRPLRHDRRFQSLSSRTPARADWLPEHDLFGPLVRAPRPSAG